MAGGARSGADVLFGNGGATHTEERSAEVRSASVQGASVQSESVRDTSRAPTRWGRLWLEGAGAALLLAPGPMWKILSPTHIYNYHHLLPLRTVARALALELVLLSVAAMAAVRLLEIVSAAATRRRDGSRRSSVQLLWAVWLGLLAARGMQAMLVAEVVRWQEVSAGRTFLVAAGGLIALSAISGEGYRRMIRSLRYGILLLGISLLWIVPELVAGSFRHEPYDVQEFEKPLPPAPPGHRRIVWLLFDGLSYDQTFEHRWPGLALPNFDRLHAQSVTFSAMGPDGKYTEDVVPSLLLGRKILSVRGTSDGWMLYQSSRQGPWQRFNGSASLFADAERQGWTTGLMGSFNPYCRLLRDQLDFCWMDMPPLPEGFSRDKSTLGNLVAPLSFLWTQGAGEASAGGETSARTSLDEVKVVQVADRLIADERVDFCFVHLPLPHPPGHYDRKTGRIVLGGSYIDNLALSDRILARMLADVAKTNAAERTTIVLSSDHSWRVWMWRNAFGWTREDEAASGDGRGFDPRPTLLVRFPGETSGLVIRRPVPLLAMHDLMERTITGEIGSAQQLQDWAARQ